MPPMMQMFPPQFPGVPQPQPQTQGNQSNQDSSQISQHQMSSFFSFPENVSEFRDLNKYSFLNIGT